MQVKCPACRTIFKLNSEQLAVRGGLVRCGICTAIFQAEQRLIKPAPETETKTAPAVTEEITAPLQKNKRKRLVKSRRATDRRRGRVKSVDAQLTKSADIPVVSEYPELTRLGFSWLPAFWSVGSVLLIILLSGQFIYFYRNELARYPAWRPGVTEFCRYADCELIPRQDIARIELLKTTIAPHPKYENALRIRATLSNRATFPQAYPWMEVNLTNNAGTVIARRTFAPTQYLESQDETVMTPHVVAHSLIDVTNPDGKAVGYEIRLVTP